MNFICIVFICIVTFYILICGVIPSQVNLTFSVPIHIQCFSELQYQKVVHHMLIVFVLSKLPIQAV